MAQTKDAFDLIPEAYKTLCTDTGVPPEAPKQLSMFGRAVTRHRHEIIAYGDVNDSSERKRRQYIVAAGDAIVSNFSLAKRLSRAVNTTLSTRKYDAAMRDVGLPTGMRWSCAYRYDEKRGGFMVYPNLPTSTGLVIVEDPYSTISIDMSTVSALLLSIQNDRQDEKKKMRWEGRRLVKHVFKKEFMTVERALTRFTNLQSRYEYSDSEIRDIAEKFRDCFRPTEMLIATDVAGIRDMYDRGGPSSCMVDTDHRSFSWMKDAGSHPCAIYLDYPRCTPVYIKKRGRVMARCMVFDFSKDNDGSLMVSGRMYSANGWATATLYALMEEKWPGIQRRDHVAKAMYKESTFTFKGVPYQGSYALAVPHYDDINEHFFTAFNATTKEFHVRLGSQSRPNNSNGLHWTRQEHGTRGYLLASELSEVSCEHCGNSIRPGATRYSHQDRPLHFCSPSCVRDHAGVVFATRGDGAQIVVDEEGTVQDPCNADQFYTTHQAAIDLGGNLAIPSDIALRDELDSVSTHGAIVEIGGTRYRLAYSIPLDKVLDGDTLNADAEALLQRNSKMKIVTRPVRDNVQVHNYQMVRTKGHLREDVILSFMAEAYRPDLSANSMVKIRTGKRPSKKTDFFGTSQQAEA